MNKEEFNELNVIDQIEYINNQLEDNKSVTSVCKGIGIGRSTVRDRFKKINYIYSKDLNKYVYNGCITDVLSEQKVNNRCNTSDIKINHNIEVMNIKKSDILTEVIEKSDEEIRKTLLDLVNNYEIIKNIIDIHKCNTSVVKNQIIIDLDESESKLATLRVNSKILDRFNEFCSLNKQYKKVDILSQAIKEFLDKYM